MSDVEQLVRKLKEIPPLAEMQAMLQAVSDDNVDFQELAKVIESSPPVAARIIKVANSAFYSLPSRANSVKDAIIRVLGLDLVRSLIVGLAASSTFRTEKCPGFDTHRYWCSALLTAHLARRLARVVGIEGGPDPEDAYLNGLLHNIGVIALAHVSPAEMAAAFAAAEREPERPLREIETQVLGLDHRQAGVLIATQWGLPETLQTVIGHYPLVDYRGPEWPACMLTRICAEWARQSLGGTAKASIDEAAVLELKMGAGDLNEVIDSAHQEVQSIIDLAKMFA